MRNPWLERTTSQVMSSPYRQRWRVTKVHMGFVELRTPIAKFYCSAFAFSPCLESYFA